MVEPQTKKSVKLLEERPSAKKETKPSLNELQSMFLERLNELENNHAKP